jgi:DNA-binding MarR family transcriptional regulator
MSSDKRNSLRRQVGEEVRAFQCAVDAVDEAVAERLGVNRTDLRCLDVLLQLGEATPGELCTRLGLTTGSVTAMLDRLETMGYLSRSRHPSDRRKVVVRPSREVARLGGKFYGPIAEAGARSIAGYDSRDLELLIGFLRQSRKLQEQHVERVRGMPSRRRRP